MSGGAAELQDECCKLQDVIDKMVTLHFTLFKREETFNKEETSSSTFQVVVVKKMERLTALQQGVQDLEEFQFGLEGRKIPLFHSWNAKHFSEFTCYVFSMFQRLSRVFLFQRLSHMFLFQRSRLVSCWNPSVRS